MQKKRRPAKVFFVKRTSKITAAKEENQKRNVVEIAHQAGKLYDQFVNLTNDLIKVGNQLKIMEISTLAIK